MAVTLSSMIPLGSPAPDFSLFDTVSGNQVSLQGIKSPKGTVIMFICNHCPFVKHVFPEILKLTQEYEKKGITFVAISSNDPVTHPEDGPEKMSALAKTLGFNFPYLFDESQQIAKAYDAVCTPDFFIFDGNLKCVYRGQLDDSRPNNSIPVTGADLRSALDCLIAGKPIDSQQKPSMGCNIKWKS
ncbi:MAG: thioredoxin family protein [Alphaproteobacteria bacterium]|nr:thioredoxin family protein [Alphaproteobacteria bacterium]